MRQIKRDLTSRRWDMTRVTPNSSLAIVDLRAFLAGPWRLERALEDRRLGHTGTLRGIAEFVADGDELLYRERGELTIEGYTGPTTRAYRFRFPEPHRAEVCFEDGRPFHDLDLSRGVWQAVHHCEDDLYRGTFRVLGPDAWEAAWRIAGPRKDQTLVGTYRRGG